MKKWQQKNRLTINGWTGCYQAVCVLHLFSMCQLLFFPPPPYLGFVQYLTEREKNDNKGSYCHLLVQLDSSWLHFSSSREGSLETKKTSNATVADAFSFFSSPCEFYSSSRVCPAAAAHTQSGRIFFWDCFGRNRTEWQPAATEMLETFAGRRCHGDRRVISIGWNLSTQLRTLWCRTGS